MEHTLSQLKNWKIPRDRWLKGNGIPQAMLDSARLHNLALIGYLKPHTGFSREGRSIVGYVRGLGLSRGHEAGQW